jgi:two-component system LytT family response regulator
MIRVGVVDDEPLAREGLRLRLAREPDVEVVGEAGNGEAAVELVRGLTPDLLFLDVRMPVRDGFETLAKLAEVHLPLVIFVTAFDTYAVRAFEVHALDYLLKPVEDARLAEALRRAREELSRAEPSGAADRVASLLDSAGASPTPGDAADPAAAPLTRFVVRDRGRFRLVPVADVRWIVSASNYVELHTREGTQLARMTLAEAESRLSGFKRVHRTLLVRESLVASVVPTEHGDFRLVLDDGTELPMSRRYRERLLGGGARNG